MSLETKQEAEQKTNFCNPYFSLKEEMKKYFSLLNDGSVILAPNFTAPFKPRKTQHHYCTSQGPSDIRYYSCRQCEIKISSSVNSYYCQACWVPELHVGHQYKQFQNKSCACGRTLRLSRQSFCSSHGFGKPIVLDPPISEQDRAKFVGFFAPFFQVFFYQYYNNKKHKDDKLFCLLLKELNKLIEGSTFYSLLTVDLLKAPSNFNPAIKGIEGNIFNDLLELSKGGSVQNYFETFIKHIMNNFESMVEIARIFSNVSIDYQTYCQFLYFFKKFENIQVNLALLKEGVILDFYGSFKFERWISTQPSAFQLVRYSLEKKITFIKTSNESPYLQDSKCLKQILDLSILNLNFQHCKYLEKKIFQFFPKTQVLIPLLSSIEKMEENDSPFNYLLHNSANTIKILSILGRAYQYNMSKISKFRASLKLHPQKLDRLQALLMVAAHRFQFMLNPTNNQNPFQKMTTVFVFIALFNHSLNKERLLAAMQDTLKIMAVDFKQNRISFVYLLICYLLHHEEIILRAKLEYQLCVQKYDKNSQIIQEQDQKLLEDLFKQYLYKKQQIEKRNLYQKRKTGMLEFKNAAKILKELCTYDEDKQLYIYTSDIKFDRPGGSFNLFSQTPRPRNQTTIQTEFALSPQIKEFAAMFFNSQAVEIEKISKQVTEFKQQSAEIFYLVICIMADKFTGGNNPTIRRVICRIKENYYRWSILQKESVYYQEALQMLCLKKREQQYKQKIQEEEFDEESEEYERNKQLIVQRSSKTCAWLQQRLFSKSSLKNADESEDICSICHQNGSQDSPLVFLSNFQKDKTLHMTIHLHQNKANLLFNTCFHSVHPECFELQKQETIVFHCPICNQSSNCLLPRYYAFDDKEQYHLAEKIFVASYTPDDKQREKKLFPLLFKHAINSYGLNSLIVLNSKITDSNRELTDLFIVRMMEDMYAAASQFERTAFNSHIKDFFQQLRNCSERTRYLVQYLAAKAILKKLNKFNSFQEKQLIAELASLLPHNQYALIKKNLQKLTESSIIVPQPIFTNEDNLIRRSLSFNWVSPPQTSQEIFNIMKQKCATCERKAMNYFLCMFCGDAFCHQCFSTQDHFQKYNGCVFVLSFEGGEISYSGKNRRSTSFLYYNEFKFTFQISWDMIGKQDVYRLSEGALKEFIKDIVDN